MLQSQFAGREDQQRVVAVPRPGDSERGAEHHSEHDRVRGRAAAHAALLPQEHRLRRTLAIRQPLHQGACGVCVFGSRLVSCTLELVAWSPACVRVKVV